MYDLGGRVALVTGAGRGVGRGIAQVLAEQGADVVVNDLHAERAAAVAEEIGARALPFDVGDWEAVQAAFAGLAVDILVNNAGVPEDRYQGAFADSEPEDWEPDIRLNVYGTLHTTRAALPAMRAGGRGRIVQISSGVAARGVPYGRSLYGLGKAAVEGHLRHLALEVAGDGITVNALSLGLMANATEYADPDVVALRLAATPVGRAGEPREAGAAVAWLCSEDAAFVTGQVIHLNGGAYQGR